MNAKKGRKRGAWHVDREIKLDSILTLSRRAVRCLRQTEHEAVKQVIIAQPELMVMMRCGSAVRAMNCEFTRSARDRPLRREGWRHAHEDREQQRELVEGRQKKKSTCN
jgi:hypothetical protein